MGCRVWGVGYRVQGVGCRVSRYADKANKTGLADEYQLSALESEPTTPFPVSAVAVTDAGVLTMVT